MAVADQGRRGDSGVGGYDRAKKKASHARVSSHSPLS